MNYIPLWQLHDVLQSTHLLNSDLWIDWQIDLLGVAESFLLFLILIVLPSQDNPCIDIYNQMRDHGYPKETPPPDNFSSLNLYCSEIKQLRSRIFPL